MTDLPRRKQTVGFVWVEFCQTDKRKRWIDEEVDVAGNTVVGIQNGSYWSLS